MTGNHRLRSSWPTLPNRRHVLDRLIPILSLVVVAGEAAAWAGTITDLTTRLTQRSGKTSGLNEPPPNAICKMRRRSTVIVEDPPLARSMRRPRNIAKYPTARFRSSHNIGPLELAFGRGSGSRTAHRSPPRGRPKYDAPAAAAWAGTITDSNQPLRGARRGGRRRRRGRSMGRHNHRLNNRLDPAFGQNQRAQ